jgi:large subunit ribosomal protein L28
MGTFMARKCALTDKGVLAGNNVSHSNRKTRCRFLPNLKSVTLLSEALGAISLRIAVKTLRTIDKKGGIDRFLLDTSNKNLTEEAISLKAKIKKKTSN